MENNNYNFHELNRLSWNEATKAHNSHKGDQVQLLKDGWDPLFDEEKGLMGDISGMDICHLQCNSGQDSLSLARMGANVTGVDISNEAIEFAKYLSINSGINASFEQCDIIDWMPTQTKKYDIVFCSYGTICWIGAEVFDKWAKGIAHLLKPDTGRFIIIDFHPFLLYFDNKWKPSYDYFFRGPIEENGVGDYVDDSGDALKGPGTAKDIEPKDKFENPHRSYEFFHGIGDIISTLINGGLSIDHFKEYPYVNGWKGFEDMKDIGNRRFETPSTIPKLPLMYSIIASLKK